MEQGLFGGLALFSSSSAIDLLLSQASSEVMTFHAKRGQALSFPKGGDDQDPEQFICLMLLSGRVKLIRNGSERDLAVHEYLAFSKLEEHIRLIPHEDSLFLIFSNAGIYKPFSERLSIVKDLVAEIQSKDGPTDWHLKRVSMLCNKLGVSFGLSTRDLTELNFAAYFHDLGKLKIPDSILKKPGRFSPEEYRTMQLHVRYSAEMFLEAYRGQEGDLDCGKISAIIMQHHEKLDGSGYPHGIAVQDMLRESRILAVVDAFDAMISDRVYSPSMPYDIAIEELLRNPLKYDIAVVRALADLYLEVERNL